MSEREILGDVATDGSFEDLGLSIEGLWDDGPKLHSTSRFKTPLTTRTPSFFNRTGVAKSAPWARVAALIGANELGGKRVGIHSH